MFSAIFHICNLRACIRVLSTDEAVRHLLSGELLGLVEAARAVRNRLETEGEDSQKTQGDFVDNAKKTRPGQV